MASAMVTDAGQEDFLKPPPPKKKWLQEYIEKDAQQEPAAAASSITEHLSTEAREFVRLFDKGTDQIMNTNLKQLSENKNNQGNIMLSQEVIGGVVQGVIDQFQSFFESGCVLAPTRAPAAQQLIRLLDPARNENLRHLGARPEELVVEDEQSALQLITPVVQSVITQFLSGSCRHKEPSSSLAARSRSVIRYKSREREAAAIHQEQLMAAEHLAPEHNENEALNLSLPKVTFASADRCYTLDSPSAKSFQLNKSEVISSLKRPLPAPSPPCQALPVIRHTSTGHVSLYPPQPVSLPSLEAIQKSFPVIRPLPVHPLAEQSPPCHTAQSAASFLVARAAPLVPSRAARERQEMKPTGSSTREVHNRHEKNRRAHLKMCFEELAVECSLDPKKTSNLTVIQSAYKYSMSLARREREQERSMASLLKDKIALQLKLDELTRGLPARGESDHETSVE